MPENTRAPDVLEEEIKLQAANAMRWSSQVFIILSLLRVSKETLDILDTTQLTTHEHNCLQDLCDIFKPFQVVADLVQGEQSVTASLVIPCV